MKFSQVCQVIYQLIYLVLSFQNFVVLFPLSFFFLVEKFSIIDPISLLIIGLLRFSISLLFSLGRLHDSRNLTIYSKFFNFLTYNCSYYSSRIDGDSDCALLSGCAAVCAPKLGGTLGCARLPECVCLPAVLCS